MGRVKAAVKRAVGAAALLPVVSVATKEALRRRVNVVYMHYVGDLVPYYAEFYAGTTVDRLDADLRFLRKHFELSSVSDVVGGATCARDSQPRLAVTFDDGFDMLRSGAIDVLEAHDVQATAFVITGMVDNKNLMWRNKLSTIKALREPSVFVRRFNDLMGLLGLHGVTGSNELLPASSSWPMDRKEELADHLWIACDMPPLDEFLEEHQPYFTWEGLRGWCSRGHDVGLHTHTHPYCARLTDDSSVQAEVIAPAELLRGRLGIEFLPLSYPFGSRLDRGIELELFERRVFDCSFGIDGFATRETPAYRLERACGEEFLRFTVFGRSMLGLPRAAATGE